MSVFVTDTHPLLWFTLNQQRNLSAPALRTFTDADSGLTYIHIPSMVLYEVAILERLGRIKLDGGFMRWTRDLLGNEGSGLRRSNRQSSHSPPDTASTRIPSIES